MKNLNIITTISIFILFFSNLTFAANASIVYIDFERIMNSSKAGKASTKKLEGIHKSNIESFKKKQKSLKDEELKILSQKNILSSTEYDKKVVGFKKKAQSYNEERKTKIDAVTKKKINATKKIVSMINPLLAEYAAKNNISMIIRKKNIIMGKADLDITNEILLIVDKKIKTIKID